MSVSILLEDAAVRLEETSRSIELSRRKRLHARAIAAIAHAQDEAMREKMRGPAGRVRPAGPREAGR